MENVVYAGTVFEVEDTIRDTLKQKIDEILRKGEPGWLTVKLEGQQERDLLITDAIPVIVY